MIATVYPLAYPKGWTGWSEKQGADLQNPDTFEWAGLTEFFLDVISKDFRHKFPPYLRPKAGTGGYSLTFFCCYLPHRRQLTGKIAAMPLHHLLIHSVIRQISKQIEIFILFWRL